jgi:Ca-activated chloride channel family protein
MLSRVFLSAFLAVQLFSQQSAAPQPETRPIKVSVNEVVVPVTVTDEKGRFVSDLDQKDFLVLDQGKPATITYFSRERQQPVVVGFLLDLSNSNRSNWPKFQDAAAELVLALLPGKKLYAGYLIGYGAEADLMVNTTTDPDKIVEKIRKLKPGGGAALYDAIYKACTNRQIVDGEPVDPRRVLVIVGDGNDNASSHTLNEVLEIAQRNLVTIYGVSTMAFGFSNEGDKNLVKLAEETGGRVEYPLQNVYKDVSGYLSQPRDEGNYAIQPGTGGYAAAISSAVFGSITNIAGEITTQYILRYRPEYSDNTKVFRTINVKVNLANVKVRARTGYYPLNPQ